MCQCVMVRVLCIHNTKNVNKLISSHLQKQAVANDAKDDFKVQTGRNGRIVVHLDSLEEQEKPRSYSKSEYTDLRSIMNNQAHHRHDSTWLVENGKFSA